MIERIYRVTVLTTFVGIGFCLFFQINKRGPFRAINPFLDDPYDAVGSFAVQGVLLIGILTYARALRLQDSPGQVAKARLIQRGNLLVLFAILATLVADTIAQVIRPFPPSYWGNVLRLELVLMWLLALVLAIAVAVVYARVPTAPPPPDLTPADGIDDLWTLVRVPVTKAGSFLPRPFVDWILPFNSDRLFARVPWFDPRPHPWRFVCVLGLLVGMGLALMQLQEGLPSSLKIGLLLAGIFISGEFLATLVGFAILGGYLGLRPSFNKGS